MSDTFRASLSRRQLLQAASGVGMAAIAISARGRNAHGQPTQHTITVSHSVNTTIYAPHLVAQEVGFFAKNGLQVSFVVPGGGARVAQVVAGDQAQYGLGDTGHPVLISERGRPCQMLFATDTRCSYANIIVRQELWDQGLNTLEKLATMPRPDGSPRVIAATAIGSGTWVYGNFVLSQVQASGKSVNDQVKWVGGGGSSTMLGGLKSGQFDAMMAVPEWIQAAQEGGFGHALYDVTSTAAWDAVFHGNVPSSVGFALKSTIEAEPGITQAYVTAMYQAMQWLKGRNPEEVFEKIGPKYMSTFKKEVVVEQVKYYQGIFNYGLLISRKDFDNTKRVMIPWVTKNDFSYDTIADMRFVEQAMKA
ncbi:MAG TPA: ABC transporter substrate-binding protein [bacterium]|nr:ABC transporter substrate-binding protein [bacterium]